MARPLTRAQQARRQRVIDAAMALGLEGGYEAVQMRDVAARADVAMGTVYRYFTSKDHLLAATLVHWVEMLDTRIGQHPPRGDHPADRVLDVLDRALRAMGRQPKLVAAVFTSLSSPDPAAVGLPAADHAADGGDHRPRHGRAPVWRSPTCPTVPA